MGSRRFAGGVASACGDSIFNVGYGRGIPFGSGGGNRIAQGEGFGNASAPGTIDQDGGANVILLILSSYRDFGAGSAPGAGNEYCIGLG